MRVNSLSSGLTDDDLAVVLRAPHLHGIVLPKVRMSLPSHPFERYSLLT